MDELLARVRQGHVRSLARLITCVENAPECAEMAVRALYPLTGRAHVVGITGPPGSGKSTLVNELAAYFSDQGRRIGIVAVDPSSPFTGGALLGDRLRMPDLAARPNVFIRSMASRGNLGGLAQATANVVKILDAAGFDLILVETVGAGQAEVDIAAAAHTTVVIEAPGMGDDVQSIKAGILEIADILVVNKADKNGARRTVSALETMLHMNQAPWSAHHAFNEHGRESNEMVEAGWHIKVLQTVATEGQGIAEVAAEIEAHRSYLQASGEWLQREKQRSRRELRQLLQARLMGRLTATIAEQERERFVTAVAQREMDPYTAVARLLGQGD